jgi:hypothetical protein
LSNAISSANISLATVDASYSEVDVSLSTAISTEISNRASADIVLSNAISSANISLATVDASYSEVDVSLSTAISTEISNRASADIVLSNAISSANISLATVDSSHSEVDVSLSTAISTEISNRASADISISSILSTETSTRTSADISIQSQVTSIADGTPAVLSLLTTLTNAISNDASFAYHVLSTDISLATVDASLSEVDVSLSTAISTETSDRIAATNTYVTLETAQNISGEKTFTNTTVTLDASSLLIIPLNAATGKVLMSDASGFASWNTITSSITYDNIYINNSATYDGNGCIELSGWTSITNNFTLSNGTYKLDYGLIFQNTDSVTTANIDSIVVRLAYNSNSIITYIGNAKLKRDILAEATYELNHSTIFSVNDINAPFTDGRIDVYVSYSNGSIKLVMNKTITSYTAYSYAHLIKLA